MFRIATQKLLKYNPDTRSEFINILTRNLQKMKDFYDLCDKRKRY